jgi:hypothetical protein
MNKTKGVFAAIGAVLLIAAISSPSYSWLRVESQAPAQSAPGASNGIVSGTIDLQVDVGNSVSMQDWDGLDLMGFIPGGGLAPSSASFPEGKSGAAVVSIAVRNISNMDAIARINLKGPIWSSSSYGDKYQESAAHPASLQVHRLKGWNSALSGKQSGWLELGVAPQSSDMIWYPNHNALEAAGFVPGSLAKNSSYDYTEFYDEYATADLGSLGLKSKTFIGVASILENGDLDFSLPDSIKSLGFGDSDGDDFLYAYLPTQSALIYSQAIKETGASTDNSLQYALFSLPLTLLEEDSFDEGYNPQIVAYGVQADMEAVNAFFGAGVYEKLHAAIMPPDI